MSDEGVPQEMLDMIHETVVEGEKLEAYYEEGERDAKEHWGPGDHQLFEDTPAHRAAYQGGWAHEAIAEHKDEFDAGYGAGSHGAPDQHAHGSTQGDFAWEQGWRQGHEHPVPEINPNLTDPGPRQTSMSPITADEEERSKEYTREVEEQRRRLGEHEDPHPHPWEPEVLRNGEKPYSFEQETPDWEAD